jgi:sulfopyruvate decarboxylase TPP-binding subunit
VPDRVLTPLIAAVETDPFFAAFQTVREEQAVGIVAGAWRGGMHGIVLMQTFGVATLPNALVCACQIPLPRMVSERSTLGEVNLGQATVCCTMRPVLVALGIEHRTITRLGKTEFIGDRPIREAVATRALARLILSPLLAGGSRFRA